MSSTTELPSRPLASRRTAKKKAPIKQEQQHNRWKSEDQQRIYSSKLIEALAKVNLNPSSPSAPKRGRAVREAADRALAVAAKGRTLWSRAILGSRLKLKFRKPHNRPRYKRSPPSRQRVSVVSLKGKKTMVQDVQRKARVLGRMIPGCDKQSFPVILEETTDYIAALEMQVRAMTALANLLSNGSPSSSTSSSHPPE